MFSSCFMLDGGKFQEPVPSFYQLVRSGIVGRSDFREINKFLENKSLKLPVCETRDPSPVESIGKVQGRYSVMEGPLANTGICLPLLRPINYITIFSVASAYDGQSSYFETRVKNFGANAKCSRWVCFKTALMT